MFYYVADTVIVNVLENFSYILNLYQTSGVTYVFKTLRHCGAGITNRPTVDVPQSAIHVDHSNDVQVPDSVVKGETF